GGGVALRESIGSVELTDAVGVFGQLAVTRRARWSTVDEGTPFRRWALGLEGDACRECVAGRDGMLIAHGVRTSAQVLHRQAFVALLGLDGATCQTATGFTQRLVENGFERVTRGFVDVRILAATPGGSTFVAFAVAGRRTVFAAAFRGRRTVLGGAITDGRGCGSAGVGGPVTDGRRSGAGVGGSITARRR